MEYFIQEECPGMTQVEVARKLNISRHDVARIERRAIRKLRERVPELMLLAVFRQREFAAPTGPRKQAM